MAYPIIKVLLKKKIRYVDTEALEDADVVMAYATCFLTDDGESLAKLSKVCGLASGLLSGMRDALVQRLLTFLRRAQVKFQNPATHHIRI